MLPMIAGFVMGQRSAARASAMGVVADSMRGGSSSHGVTELDERVDRLLLVIEAMWSLLKENGYSDAQLAARIKELDEADGSTDGRRVGKPTPCRSCKSMVAPGLPRCQICGAETGFTPGPFDRI